MQRAIWAALLMALTAIGSGCQATKVENERLLGENRELRAQLEQAVATRDMAENERNRLAGEVNRLQAGRTAGDAAVGANTPASVGGFGGIGGVETVVQNGDIHVRIPGDVLFDAGKSVLKASAKRTLEQIATVIKNEHPGATIRIEGYTDTDPIKQSPWEDNLELSAARSSAVFRHFKTEGLDPKKMYVAGFGEYHPRESKARSRRVEVVVVGK